MNFSEGNRHDRRSFIGGSDARIIMGSDQAALLRLWKEKRGELEPEDLSEYLLVQLGTVTEPLPLVRDKHGANHCRRPETGFSRRSPMDGGNTRRPRKAN
jgi:hypothetical protein